MAATAFSWSVESRRTPSTSTILSLVLKPPALIVFIVYSHWIDDDDDDDGDADDDYDDGDGDDANDDDDRYLPAGLSGRTFLMKIPITLCCCSSTFEMVMKIVMMVFMRVTMVDGTYPTFYIFLVMVMMMIMGIMMTYDTMVTMMMQ